MVGGQRQSGGHRSVSFDRRATRRGGVEDGEFYVAGLAIDSEFVFGRLRRCRRPSERSIAFRSHSLTVSRVVAYRFLKEDGSLAKVGLRFGVSLRAIWAASQELPPIAGRAMSSLKP